MAQISITDITNWEGQHGHVPLGATVAVRRTGNIPRSIADSFPVSDDAVQFRMHARYTRGFVIETEACLGSDRMLSHQIALHGNYTIEGSVEAGGTP